MKVKTIIQQGNNSLYSKNTIIAEKDIDKVKTITKGNNSLYSKNTIIAEKDIDNVCNALSVVAKFKDKLEWKIEYYQKSINEATQIVEEIKTQIKIVEDDIKNDEILAKEKKVHILLKGYEKDKKTMEKIISKNKKSLEFFKSLYNKIIKININLK